MLESISHVIAPVVPANIAFPGGCTHIHQILIGSFRIVLRTGEMLASKTDISSGPGIDSLVCVRECMSMCLGVASGKTNKVCGVKIYKALWRIRKELT